MKFKSKISCLGKKISILPWQMAEQLAVEVDVKNVTEQYGRRTDGQGPLFGQDSHDQNNIKTTGQHVNLPGHSLADLMFTISSSKKR